MAEKITFADIGKQACLDRAALMYLEGYKTSHIYIEMVRQYRMAEASIRQSLPARKIKERAKLMQQVKEAYDWAQERSQKTMPNTERQVV